MRVFETEFDVFAVVDGKVYRYNANEAAFCEVRFKDCDGEIVANLVGGNNDPKDGEEGGG